MANATITNDPSLVTALADAGLNPDDAVQGPIIEAAVGAVAYNRVGTPSPRWIELLRAEIARRGG